MTGNASAKDLEELNELLESDPLLAEKFKTIDDFFYERGREHADTEGNIAFNKLWEKVTLSQSSQVFKKRTIV